MARPPTAGSEHGRDEVAAVNVAAWAQLRDQKTLAPEDLRAAHKHLTEIQDHPGLKFIQWWLAGQHRAHVDLILRQPSDDRADTYALKRAHLAGFAAGLQHAMATPNAVLHIAEQEMERQQRAAEQAAGQGDVS
jgi:hypothetical protein